MLATLLYQNTIYAGEEELAMLEKGLTLFPYESVLWKQLGEIYQKQGENERAQNVYLRGLETDTLSKELLTRLEKMYPSTAERPPLLAQARTLQSYQDKAAKFDKMSTLYQHKLREDIEKYVMQYPQDMNGHILLARVLSLSGNDLKSEEQLRQVLRQRPDNLWANLALSSLYYQAEDLDGARRALENALFYYPDNATALARLEKLNKIREK